MLLFETDQNYECFSCGLTPIVSKASAGAMEWMPISTTTSLEKLLEVSSESISSETLQSVFMLAFPKSLWCSSVHRTKKIIKLVRMCLITD